VKTDGFFEIRGAPEELLPKLVGGTLKNHGCVYFADFGDGTIKIGMTRGIKSRIQTFAKTSKSYGKPMPQRFGISPVIANHETVEKIIHNKLSRYWVERELFRVTENIVEQAVNDSSMDVLRSSMWPGCRGYFNYYGENAVKRRRMIGGNAFVSSNDSSALEGRQY
jgi:hypothetical protein